MQKPMELIQAAYCPEKEVSVHSFGRETDSEQAHWGRGSRKLWILHYVLNGEGFFNNARVGMGQGFLIKPEQMHAYHSSKEDPWQYVWVSFGGTKAQHLCEKLVDADRNGIFSCGGMGELRKLFEIVLAEAGQISEERALGYFYLLLSLNEKEELSMTNKYVQEAKRYMQHHYYRSMAITEMARQLGISDRYLYNLFVESEGVSPKQYLGGLRLKRAKEMLAESSATITEVAISCGFADVLTFSRFFSEKTGMAPTGYRKKIRGEIMP